MNAERGCCIAKVHGCSALLSAIKPMACLMDWMRLRTGASQASVLRAQPPRGDQEDTKSPRS